MTEEVKASFNFAMDKQGVELIARGLMKLPIEEAQGFLKSFIDAANSQLPIEPVESTEEAAVAH